MSSILKALKRIEGQSPPPKSFPALPDSVDAKQTVNSNARRRWLLRRFITVGLVALVLVVIAVIVFQKRQFVTSKMFPAESPATKQEKSKAALEKSKIFKAKIPSKTAKQAPKRPEPTRPTRQQTKTLGAGQKTQKFRTNTSSSQSRAAVAQPSAKTTPAIPSKKLPSRTTIDTSAPKQSTRPKLTPAKKSIAGKRTASRQPAAAAQMRPVGLLLANGALATPVGELYAPHDARHAASS